MSNELHSDDGILSEGLWLKFLGWCPATILSWVLGPETKTKPWYQGTVNMLIESDIFNSESIISG
jgi:hypothetical protein